MIVQMTGIIGVYPKEFALVALCVLSSNASTSAAQPSSSGAEVAADGGSHEGGKDTHEEEKPLLNGFSLGAAYTFHILRERDSETTGEPLSTFERERAEQEGEKNKMSLGVGAVIGGCHYFTDRWSLDLELGYAYIPTEDIVEHELSAVLSGVFHFNKRGHGDVDSGAD